jgi:hypothetical protein
VSIDGSGKSIQKGLVSFVRLCVFLFISFLLSKEACSELMSRVDNEMTDGSRVKTEGAVKQTKV